MPGHLRPKHCVDGDLMNVAESGNTALYNDTDIESGFKVDCHFMADTY